jgi:hypothetical protein
MATAMFRANASPNRQQHFVFQSSQLFDLYALETKSVAYVLQGAGMNPLALMTCQVIRQEIFPPGQKRDPQDPYSRTFAGRASG